MTVKLQTEQYLEFLSLKGDCKGLSESTLVKMPHCWKSHAVAHFSYFSTKTYVVGTLVGTQKTISMNYFFLLWF